VRPLARWGAWGARQASGVWADAAALERVQAAARSHVSQAVQTDVLFQYAPAQVALACLHAAAEGDTHPASAAALAQYMAARWPVAAELQQLRAWLGAVRGHVQAAAAVPVSDDAARAIDQRVQRVQQAATPAPTPTDGPTVRVHEDEQDDDDDDG
jgi:hypothetical protein